MSHKSSVLLSPSKTWNNVQFLKHLKIPQFLVTGISTWLYFLYIRSAQHTATHADGILCSVVSSIHMTIVLEALLSLNSFYFLITRWWNSHNHPQQVISTNGKINTALGNTAFCICQSPSSQKSFGISFQQRPTVNSIWSVRVYSQGQDHNASCYRVTQQANLWCFVLSHQKCSTSAPQNATFDICLPLMPWQPTL